MQPCKTWRTSKLLDRLVHLVETIHRLFTDSTRRQSNCNRVNYMHSTVNSALQSFISNCIGMQARDANFWRAFCILPALEMQETAAFVRRLSNTRTHRPAQITPTIRYTIECFCVHSTSRREAKKHPLVCYQFTALTSFKTLLKQEETPARYVCATQV